MVEKAKTSQALLSKTQGHGFYETIFLLEYGVEI
jgi:hypothetical protein